MVELAGRDNLSFAFTLCKNNTHDEFYFQNTKRITGDLPPSPYIEFSGNKILKRTVTAEVLRQAFSKLTNPPEWTGESNHGVFGAASEWPEYSPQIEGIIKNDLDLHKIVKRLSTFTDISDPNKNEVLRFIEDDLIDEITQIATDTQNFSESNKASRDSRNITNVWFSYKIQNTVRAKWTSRRPL